MRVLRVYHSGVVSAWRARDRAMRGLGVEVRHVCARRWNEGGRDVHVDGADSFVAPARTLGRHPYRFVYDPTALLRELRANRFDLIDVHEEPASLAHAEVRALARIAGHARVPMLFYGAQNIPKTYPPPFRWLEQAAFRRSSGTYVCNAAAGEIFRAKGFGGEVRVIGLGVDVERFAPAPVEGGAGALRIGYVGRLEEHKGVQVVLAALGGSPHHLEVYGAGPHLGELERLALAHDTRATFHGGAPHDTLPDVYRSFDLVVIPSQVRPRWMEQFGRVAVEAMASGVPVLAAATGSLPEVVGEAGVLLPADDTRAWREAIESLAGDPARRAVLAAAGVTRAAQYSWDAIAAQHVDLYRHVLDGAGR